MTMLKQSYGSIIASLINLQKRRSETRRSEESVQPKPKENTVETRTIEEFQEMTVPVDSCLYKENKYDIDLFLDSKSRESTFNKLFAEVSRA